MEQLSHSNYISGLRALAIVPVVLFHTNPTLFSNGYLGVDIFFVISGYLIAKTLITNSYNINLNKLINFYLKRIRRTLPALIFVIFTITPFFLFILSPVELINFSQSLFATVLFFSNFLFGSENNYWGAVSELKPLLHTWSLSIEWQFYLLFPLVFFFKNKKILIIIIFILSLLSSVLLNFNDYHFFLAGHKVRLDHFFFSTNRIWEFLAGSLIFLYNSENKNQFISNIVSLVGLILLISSFIFFNTQKHPGIYTLVPILGTILLIKYSIKGTLTNLIFNNYFLLHLGSISYSLYLWHQPILAYFKNVFNFNLSFQHQIFAIFLSYILSLFTYNFIEKKFYEKKFLKNKLLIILSVISILLIIITSFFINFKKKFINKSTSQKIFLLDKKFPNRVVEGKKINISNIKNHFDKNDKYKILIIGDSYAVDLFVMLHYNKVLNKTFQFTYQRTNADDTSQIIRNRIDADAIILTEQFYEDEVNADFFLKFKKKYVNDNQKLIIMGRPNEFIVGNYDPLTFILIKNQDIQDLYTKSDYQKIDEHLYRILNDKVFRINSNIRKIANDLKFIYLDRFDYACSDINKTCKSTDSNGLPIYIDQGHLSTHAVPIFNKLIIEKNWFKQVNELAKNN